jgi:tetratricopeptide (TPR) repeat protein
MKQGDDGRLIGWKAIGAFVGRDERTVRRWSTERGMPVNRVPGGGSATVWADPEALRAWMAGGTEATEDRPVDCETPSAKNSRPRVMALAAGVVALLAAAPFVLESTNRAPPAKAHTVAPYGTDAKANELYREANYGVQRRSVAGLLQAAESFGALTASHPRNPAGYVGLAEANLLLREFNSLPNEVAYRRAAKAAEQALTLDPRSATALRALGFVRYYGDGDRKQGLALFERALKLDPSQAQSHHWYGTALLGEGRLKQAAAELEKARALDPASSAICADAAYAKYLTGHHVDAITKLKRIVEVDPQFSGAHRYLARFYLIEGRDAEYLAAAQTEARLRVDPAQTEALNRAEAAFKSGGRKAMVAAMIAHETQRFQQSGESAIRVAMFHAAAGDAAGVKSWLEKAESIREPEIRSIAAFVEFVPYGDKIAFARYFKPPES